MDAATFHEAGKQRTKLEVAQLTDSNLYKNFVSNVARKWKKGVTQDEDVCTYVRNSFAKIWLAERQMAAKAKEATASGTMIGATKEAPGVFVARATKDEGAVDPIVSADDEGGAPPLGPPGASSAAAPAKTMSPTNALLSLGASAMQSLGRALGAGNDGTGVLPTGGDPASPAEDTLSHKNFEAFIDDDDANFYWSDEEKLVRASRSKAKNGGLGLFEESGGSSSEGESGSGEDESSEGTGEGTGDEEKTREEEEVVPTDGGFEGFWGEVGRWFEGGRWFQRRASNAANRRGGNLSSTITNVVVLALAVVVVIVAITGSGKLPGKKKRSSSSAGATSREVGAHLEGSIFEDDWRQTSRGAGGAEAELSSAAWEAHSHRLARTANRARGSAGKRVVVPPPLFKTDHDLDGLADSNFAEDLDVGSRADEDLAREDLQTDQQDDNSFPRRGGLLHGHAAPPSVDLYRINFGGPEFFVPWSSSSQWFDLRETSLAFFNSVVGLAAQVSVLVFPETFRALFFEKTSSSGAVENEVDLTHPGARSHVPLTIVSGIAGGFVELTDLPTTLDAVRLVDEHMRPRSAWAPCVAAPSGGATTPKNSTTTAAEERRDKNLRSEAEIDDPPAAARDSYRANAASTAGASSISSEEAPPPASPSQKSGFAVLSLPPRAGLFAVQGKLKARAVQGWTSVRTVSSSSHLDQRPLQGGPAARGRSSPPEESPPEDITARPARTEEKRTNVVHNLISMFSRPLGFGDLGTDLITGGTSFADHAANVLLEQLRVRTCGLLAFHTMGTRRAGQPFLLNVDGECLADYLSLLPRTQTPCDDGRQFLADGAAAGIVVEEDAGAGARQGRSGGGKNSESGGTGSAGAGASATSKTWSNLVLFQGIVAPFCVSIVVPASTSGSPPSWRWLRMEDYRLPISGVQDFLPKKLIVNPILDKVVFSLVGVDLLAFFRSRVGGGGRTSGKNSRRGEMNRTTASSTSVEVKFISPAHAPCDSPEHVFFLPKPVVLPAPPWFPSSSPDLDDTEGDHDHGRQHRADLNTDHDDPPAMESAFSTTPARADQPDEPLREESLDNYSADISPVISDTTITWRGLDRLPQFAVFSQKHRTDDTGGVGVCVDGVKVGTTPLLFHWSVPNLALRVVLYAAIVVLVCFLMSLSQAGGVVSVIRLRYSGFRNKYLAQHPNEVIGADAEEVGVVGEGAPQNGAAGVVGSVVNIDAAGPAAGSSIERAQDDLVAGKMKVAGAKSRALKGWGTSSSSSGAVLEGGGEVGSISGGVPSAAPPSAAVLATTSKNPQEGAPESHDSDSSGGPAAPEGAAAEQVEGPQQIEDAAPQFSLRLFLALVELVCRALVQASVRSVVSLVATLRPVGFLCWREIKILSLFIVFAFFMHYEKISDDVALVQDAQRGKICITVGGGILILVFLFVIF